MAICGAAPDLPKYAHGFHRRCGASAADFGTVPWIPDPEFGTFRAMTIFELRTAYHDSLANMRVWLSDDALSGNLTVLDRLSILDAWQQEMLEFFESNGFCLQCSRRLSRCACATDES